MTSILADGATEIIYIGESAGAKYYNINNGGNTPIVSYPIQITNTNGTPSSNILKVIFSTGLTIDDTNLYFEAASDGIQFGSTSLDIRGNAVSITVTVDNYGGFIQNGSGVFNGQNYIYVYNLIVDGTGYIQTTSAGWVGRRYYGKGATNTYIINCSSAGDIYGGGIVGANAENVTLIGCSSSGAVEGDTGGGIVGKAATSVTLQQCWSTGAINTNGGGGLVGGYCVSADIVKCYSQGIISGNNTGGIIGANSGTTSVTITSSYSSGAIQGGNAGGICGSIAPSSGINNMTITNCYSIGNINNTGSNFNGGICGLLSPSGSGAVSVIITNCYTVGTVVLSKGYIIANQTTINGINSAPIQYILTNNYSEAGSVGGTAGTWSSTNANTVLTGAPTGSTGVGSTWASRSANTAYELANFGKTPYQTQNISDNAPVQSFSQTVEQGSQTTQALSADASGNAFAILDKSGGDSDSYPTITISRQTGKISTTSETAVGTYTLYVRSLGSYNITTFNLTVIYGSSSATCCATNTYERGLDYSQIMDQRIGNRLIAEHAQNPTMKFDGYSQFLKYKMAQASRKS